METGSWAHCPLQWFVERESGECDEDEKVALIILNYKLHGLEHVIRKYWEHFTVVACADGGSNVLFDIVDLRNARYIPHFVCGDMDSARKEILQIYKSKGCTVKMLPDQNKTDLTKTLDYLIDLKKNGQLQFSSVYVVNGIGGRFDQTLANLNTLYSKASVMDESVYLLSEDSLSFVLEPGRHSIHLDTQLEEGHCGLIPLGEPCSSCTTTGLTWNLGNDTMELGGLISTNNLIANKEVVVENSSKLLWTMSHILLNPELLHEV